MIAIQLNAISQGGGRKNTEDMQQYYYEKEEQKMKAAAAIVGGGHPYVCRFMLHYMTMAMNTWPDGNSFDNGNVS